MELIYKVQVKIGKDIYKWDVHTSTEYPNDGNLNDEIDDQILEQLSSEIGYAIREDILKRQSTITNINVKIPNN